MSAGRLLVVDDESRFGEFVGKVAADAGYEVEVTTKGHDFQARYLEFQSTAVVVDLIMPEIEGIELVQWVAERDAPAHLSVVTGYSPEYATLAKILGEAKGLPSVSTLTKPVRVSVLRGALADISKAASGG
ncbi:MAG: response regulator [Alphaproteobacteria bacterium]